MALAYATSDIGAHHTRAWTIAKEIEVGKDWTDEERVELNGDGLRVGHPSWCAWLLRRGWQLQWHQITGLTPVATSQGGRVFYVRTQQGAAYLLPQRVQAFDDFLSRFSQASGLNTSSIGRISPPWTYQLLAVLCGGLLAPEVIVFLLLGTPMGVMG